MSVPGVTDSLVQDLTATLGAAHVLADDDLRAPFEVDWTRLPRPGAGRRATGGHRTGRRGLAACRAHGAAALGAGHAGMVGAGVPRGGEVVLQRPRASPISGR